MEESELAEYKRQISVAVTIAVIAAAGIGLFAIAAFPRGSPGVGSTRSGTQIVITPATTTLGTTEIFSSTTQAPWTYSILAQEPYLLVTPENHTFIIPFNVTTHDYSISLAYSQADSYAWLFSNGTQWLSSARPCPPVTTATLTGSGTYTVTTTVISSTTGYPPILTHISRVPCGEYPGEWWALNGTLISQHVAISPNDAQMTIQPSTIPAHYTGRMNVTLSILMPPGNYGVFFAVHIQEPDNPNYPTSLLYIFYYMPVVARAG